MRTDIRAKLAVPYSAETELCAKAEYLVVDMRVTALQQFIKFYLLGGCFFIHVCIFTKKKYFRSNKID